jgi:hypothetical protein
MANGSMRGVIRDQTGTPISGVAVQVNQAGGGAATIFSDRGGTPLSNPFTNESDGSWLFYASTAIRYDIVFTKSGYTFDDTDTEDMPVDMDGDGAVLTQHLAASAVTTAKLTALCVDSTILAADSVLTAKIADANVTTAKIADGAITAAKIATGVIPTWYTGQNYANLSGHGETTLTFTHGLGSDDVVARVYLQGNIASGVASVQAQAIWRRVDGAMGVVVDPTQSNLANSQIGTLPAVPSSGNITVRVKNCCSASQNFSVQVRVDAN